MAAKYQIVVDVRDPNQRMMQASAATRPGDEIVAEKPLAELPIGLTLLFDQDSFWNPEAAYNGAEVLQNMRDRMSQRRKNRLAQLYSYGPNGDTTSLVATNSFGHEYRSKGQRYSILRNFEDISRANYSCRPNAHFTWNTRLGEAGQATIHALKHIAVGEEITISYIPGPEHSLEPREQRLSIS